MTRDELILSATKQVEIIAKKMHQRIGARIPLDDLIQIGTIGAIHAADNFDPARGVKFKTYAQYKILGALLDAVRKECGFRNEKVHNPPAILSLDAVMYDGRDTPVGPPMFTAEVPSPEAQAIATERTEWFAAHIGCISLRRRLVLLHLLAGASYPAVAAWMGVSENSVGAYRNQAVQKLRRMAAGA